MVIFRHLRVIDLGRLAYVPAWDRQRAIHEDLVQDPTASPALLLVEHDPVITVSQRQSAPAHLLASGDQLAKLGIDLQSTDRGGDITYHGPGQLVAYPILRLATYPLNVGRYMRLLETIVINTLGTFGIEAGNDPAATGVWVKLVHGGDAKICAMGVRVKRNITLHGLALNVTTDLSHFDTIVPCGLADRGVTSMEKVLRAQGRPTPPMDEVKEALVAAFHAALPGRP